MNGRPRKKGTGFPCLLLACLCLIAAGVCVWQGLRWSGQAVLLTQELSQGEAFLASVPQVWSNDAAEAAYTRWLEARGQEADEGVYASYRSPEGIQFLSRSAAWDAAGLEALYRELLQNRHGDELLTLADVTVYPEADEFAAATHTQTTQSVDITLHHPALPDAPVFTFRRNTGSIALYDGDNRTTPAAMASTLSHEYGHHFTFSHMLNVEENRLYQTEYARLRGLSKNNSYVDTSDAAFYYDHHAEYLVEIAAEDYVVLLGSPNSRTVGEYKDVSEQMYGAESDSLLLRNACPQENMELPLAMNVPGLADYFYSFLGQIPPEYAPTHTCSLELKRESRSFHLVSGTQTFVSYRITWEKAFGEDAVYTLISTGSEDNGSCYPIKTVTAGEAAEAWIGTVTRSYTASVEYWDDGRASGTRTFRVSVVLPDGTFWLSEPLVYEFSEADP